MDRFPLTVEVVEVSGLCASGVHVVVEVIEVAK
jgi:hypothetical protein